MKALNGVIRTSIGVVTFTDGRIDTVNGVPVEAGSKESQRLAIRAIADRLREQVREWTA